MLTRLTLTILDYAVNDPIQFAKRTKQVEIYLNKAGEMVDEQSSVRKITATIPIDRPSRHLAALDSDKAADYVEFLRRFGKGTYNGRPAAQALLDQARTLSSEENIEDENYWNGINLGPNLVPLSKEDFAKNWGAVQEPARFVNQHRIRPENIPSEDLLEGRDIYQRTGSASAGLQQLGQRLKAVNPTSP